MGALVIGRQPDQSIIISDLIKVTVIKTEDNLLRLKIDAPKEINIVREEIYQPKLERNEALYQFAELHKKTFANS